MKLKFWDKSPDVSFEALFPQVKLPKRRKPIIFRGIIAAIGIIWAGVGTAAMSLTAAWLTVIVYVVVIAYTIYSYATGGKKGKGGRTGLQNVDESGQLVNTRGTSEPVKVVYGKAKVGGNWVFADQSVADVNQLNVVVSWGEGECEGVADGIDWLPQFAGTGYNDLHTGGEAETFTVCTCDQTCYGYSACTCNMTCYSETCDCYNTQYGWDPCNCYNTFYSCLSCYSTCYSDWGW